MEILQVKKMQHLIYFFKNYALDQEPISESKSGEAEYWKNTSFWIYLSTQNTRVFQDPN